jgi:hypothetical protein
MFHTEWLTLCAHGYNCCCYTSALVSSVTRRSVRLLSQLQGIQSIQILLPSRVQLNMNNSVTRITASSVASSNTDICSVHSAVTDVLPSTSVCYLLQTVASARSSVAAASADSNSSAHSVSQARVYIGFTRNLARRIREHNSGRGGRGTRRYRPWFLLAWVTGFTNDMDALLVSSSSNTKS